MTWIGGGDSDYAGSTDKETLPGKQSDHHSKIVKKMAGNLANFLTSITSYAQQCAGILRLKEFDTTTPEGRSLERYRRFIGAT